MNGILPWWRRREGARNGAHGLWAVPLLCIAALARASDVDVALDDARGACRVRGTFAAPVPGAVAWEVLADYDDIGRFVRAVRTSRMERRADGTRLLRQDAVGGVFLLRRRVQVLLDIQEDPARRIAFRDVLGKDFRRYVGEWRIAADSTGTHVEYQLEAEPRATIMRAFCRGALRSAARDLLEQVRAEMIRRTSQMTPIRTERKENDP